MPALRESLKRGRKFWILITAAVALAAAAAFDWTRPPEQQRSVGFYETVIVAPYQRFVSPVASKVVHCRYTPTCSEYSAAAVRTHGFPRGLWLTTKRIFRCRPGVPLRTRDPVPPATAQLNRDVIDPSHRC